MKKTTVIIPTGMMQGSGMNPQGGPILAEKVTRREDASEWPEIKYHSCMAVIVCAFVMTALFTITAFWVLNSEWARERWLTLFFLDMVIVSIVGLYFGWTWVRKAATRKWWVEDQERARRWKIEDQALQSGEAEEEEEEERNPGWRLELMGYRILVGHYVDGKMMTRPECDGMGIGQGEWNAANDVLKALRIKNERSWKDEITFDEAIRRWNEDAYFEEDGRVRVRVGEGEWVEV